MGLWQRTNYTNPFIDYMINREIIEYDMKDAGYSLIQKYKLAPQSKIDWLGELEHRERHIAIGIMQRDDAEFNKVFQEAFKKGRQLFFEANDLSDKDVLSIKRDAIFTTRLCHHTDFGVLQYVDKEQYTSFFKFNNLEYYYNSERGSDIKGIGKKTQELHKDYFLTILNVLFNCIESRDHYRGATVLSDFCTHYKKRELDIRYYRELNAESLYRMKDTINGVTWGVEHVEFEHLPMIDIRFNFNTYLTPLIPLLMR